MLKHRTSSRGGCILHLLSESGPCDDRELVHDFLTDPELDEKLDWLKDHPELLNPVLFGPDKSCAVSRRHQVC